MAVPNLETALRELEPSARAAYRFRVAEAHYIARTDPPERALMEAVGIGADPGTFRDYLKATAKGWRESREPGAAVAAAALAQLLGEIE